MEETVNILLTGSHGYIGTRLGHHLRGAYPGENIMRIDTKNGHDYADLRNANLDVVFHLGAISTIIGSFERADEIMAVNALNLIPFFQYNKVKKFIFSSTASIYGEMKKPMSEDEAKWTDCLTPYAQSKYVAEGIIRRMCPNHAIFRFANVFGGDYGPRKEWLAPTHFMRDNPIVLYGGTQVRDFIHIDLICKALIKAAQETVTGAFNLGSGVAVPIIDVARKFSELRNVPIVYEPQRKGESMCVVLDVTKARRYGLLPEDPPENDYYS
jgi:nucleoside-diphosphate-sugar epimerase